MDKATRRKIKLWERKGAETGRLKERAANLLKKASDAELVMKSTFKALIVKTAYSAGLDALPLEAVVTGMAGLAGVAKAQRAAVAKDPSVAVAKLGGDDVKQDEGAIELIVEIGRNTSEKRFAVLDEYLTWNGRDGEWSGKVTPAVLTVFEALFEPRRLKYSVNELECPAGDSSNTACQTAENVALLTGISREDQDHWGVRSQNRAEEAIKNGFFEREMVKQGNDAIVAAFRRRLKEVAGFAFVPEPLPMKNSTNADIYYLFFAAQKPVAEKIITDIFEKYR